MSKDTAEFLKFSAAILIPALVAGSVFDARWTKDSEWLVACLWLASTLFAVGYVADGLKGAKALISSTLVMWIAAIVCGSFIAWMAIASAARSL
ncbi:hypothetical protein [Agrobacterium sp. OT33]|uniref:hypothetical protein n=1 Tax=Agrobacterium sp. OT33 TaxID=2815338 RepID=UPI001A8F3E64|nr:hypothetical protein [Agrobacterium sp. OT33]MBO0125227.1 hypothetical protein [Agrobacterium sp. OT33]